MESIPMIMKKDKQLESETKGSSTAKSSIPNLKVCALKSQNAQSLCHVTVNGICCGTKCLLPWLKHKRPIPGLRSRKLCGGTKAV